jgi:hypothetical protein
MTVDGWWGVLLNGAFGAFLTLLGALLVFWLTRWRDRKKSARERAQESVAELMKTTLALSGVRIGPEEEAIMLKLRDGLLLFYVQTTAAFPHEANWALDQSNRLMDLYEPDADVRSGRIYAAKIAPALVTWIGSGCKTKTLTKRPETAEKIYTSWLPDDVNKDVTLTHKELGDPGPDVLGKIEELKIRVAPELLEKAREAAESS